jgi:hypothetical protein
MELMQQSFATLQKQNTVSNNNARKLEAIHHSFSTVQQEMAAAEEHAQRAEKQATELERHQSMHLRDRYVVGTSPATLPPPTMAHEEGTGNTEQHTVIAEKQDQSATMGVRYTEHQDSSRDDEDIAPPKLTKPERNLPDDDTDDNGDKDSDDGMQKVNENRAKGKQRE